MNSWAEILYLKVLVYFSVLVSCFPSTNCSDGKQYLHTSFSTFSYPQILQKSKFMFKILFPTSASIGSPLYSMQSIPIEFQGSLYFNSCRSWLLRIVYGIFLRTKLVQPFNLILQLLLLIFYGLPLIQTYQTSSITFVLVLHFISSVCSFVRLV